MEKLSARQKKILNCLLDKYEDSRSYTGENRIKQSFRVNATEIWPQYGDDFADVAEVAEFEREIHMLRDEGLVDILEKNGCIFRIFAVKERLDSYYALLGRRGKRELQDDERRLYSEYALRADPLGQFSREQLARLQAGKKARFPADKAALLLRLLAVILANEEELYERELSILVLHDSKRFAKEFRRTVCEILADCRDRRELPDEPEERRATEEAILEEHLIYANPGYIYVKGEAAFLMEDGSRQETRAHLPMAFSSDFMKEVRAIRTAAPRVMTIENLTSFHRFDQPGVLAIYLSGYHSLRITRFLNKIEHPETLQWLHFGDIDPDGFLILKNLCRKTGLPFAAWQMSAFVLTQYRAYARPLEEKDRRKAQKMLNEGYYSEEMALMLRDGIKLEQEALFRDVHRLP